MNMCKEKHITLYAYENNSFIPIQGLKLLFYIELDMQDVIEESKRHQDNLDDSDFENIYTKHSPVILCLKDENDEFLQDIFSELLACENRYYKDNPVFPNYGHPELIEIQIPDN